MENRRSWLWLASLAVMLMTLATGCQRKQTASDLYNADLHFKAGLAYMQKAEFTKARREFETAINIKDDLAEYYDALGLTHYYLGNFEIAEQRILQAIEISSGIPQFYNNLANVYIKMGRYDEAIERAQQALDYPNYKTPAFAFFLKGMAQMGKNEQTEAIDSFERAIKEDPEFPNPYIQLAKHHFETGNCPEAFRRIRTALSLLDKKEPHSMLLHGKIMLECFDKRFEAMESLLTVVEIAPDTTLAEEANALLKTFRDRKRGG